MCGSKKRSRGRKITWFNPPFSANVSTNIGAKFLRIIDTCFPPTHMLHKIINRNTIKVSYRCMTNMNKILSKHNSKIANQMPGPDLHLDVTAKGDLPPALLMVHAKRVS